MARAKCSDIVNIELTMFSNSTSSQREVGKVTDSHYVSSFDRIDIGPVNFLGGYLINHAAIQIMRSCRKADLLFFTRSFVTICPPETAGRVLSKRKMKYRASSSQKITSTFTLFDV